jgi:hypothetical protein
MRAKYPWIVDGAISSSAPFMAYNDIIKNNLESSYFTVCSQAFSDISVSCANNLRTAIYTLVELAAQPVYWPQLSKAFQLCSPIQNQGDAFGIYGWLMEAMTMECMLSYPFPNYPKQSCSIMNRATDIWSAMIALNGVGGVYTNSTGQTPCNQVTSSLKSSGLATYNYLFCTEALMPLSISSESIFVPSQFNLNDTIATCLSRWGPSAFFRPDWQYAEFGGTSLGKTPKTNNSNNNNDYFRLCNKFGADEWSARSMVSLWDFDQHFFYC